MHDTPVDSPQLSRRNLLKVGLLGSAFLATAGLTASLSGCSASTPQAGDQVVQKEDVRVFVAEDVAPILDDKSLDAQPGTPGHPTFRLDRRT